MISTAMAASFEMTPDRDGPPQVGTNVREVLQLGGRQYVTDTAVTEVGPGTSSASPAPAPAAASAAAATSPRRHPRCRSVHLRRRTRTARHPRIVRPILRRFVSSYTHTSDCGGRVHDATNRSRAAA